MVKDRTWRAKKRPLPPPLPPVSPVAARTSANQEDITTTKVAGTGNRSSSAKAHARNLVKLQLHLPREVIFFDPRRRVYHSHVDLSGWRVTDASLQQLQLDSDEYEKSSFHTLTVDGSAHISVRGLQLLLEATAAGSGTLLSLRLPQCQLLSRGGGELLEGTSLPRSLTELDVSSCEWVDDKFLRSLARHCSVLATLSLAHCRRVTDYGVAAYGESYSGTLTSLDVSFCTNLTDSALLAVLVGFPSTAIPGGPPTVSSSATTRIRVLNAAGLPLVDGLTLIGLRGPCASRLESLDMSGCTILRVAALQRLARVRALIRLTTLDLSRCSLVNDQVLAALGMTCSQLAKLHLCFCSSITDVGIQRLVGKMAGIRAKDNRHEGGQEPYTDGEDDASEFPGVIECGCRQLETLDISGCFQVTNQGISALGTHCSRLRSLTLDGVRRLTFSGVRSLFRGCNKLSALRWSGILVRTSQDEVATPGACAAFFSIPHLNDTTISLLASSTLKTLHIGTTQCDADYFAAALLQARSSTSVASSLVDLDVTSLATDTLCEALGNCCANLRTLRLSRSRYFSATSFLAVLRGCPRLRALELESCEQIQDETLVELSTSPCCPHLETLVLSNDWQLTDTGIAALLRPATSLFRLDVRHCPEVSLTVLQALAAARGHVSEATRDGLTPRHPNVVAFLRREHERRAAGRKISRWLRCRLDARVSAKSTLERALAYFRRLKVVTQRIQRWYRNISAQRKQRRMIAEARRLRHEQCQANWHWIQALCVLSRKLRIFARDFIAARQRAAFEKAEQLRLLREKAAVDIQRIARGWLGRRRAVEARHARELWLQRREEAATDLQRAFRGYRSRKLTAKLRHELELVTENAMEVYSIRFLAALGIQRTMRGFSGRQHANHRAVEAYELLQLKIARSKQIQRAYRAHIARVALRRMLFRGASALQKVFRGFRGRKEARVVVLVRSYTSHPRILILMKNSIYTRDLAVAWKRKRDAGMKVAFSLQRRYRGFCGRRQARLVLARKHQRWYLEDTGARAIQHFFRSIMFVQNW
ncbi:F-box/LRR-repeat protein 4 [Phytophthora citrophthora]|uniref:F-box/LRR-repeat protein 4 n=1 Tax=Phytophthora citrophthora TaxID=4793 RepID=A0AAD9GLB0_9STRA|nr:F-box/LRR-repeat protein 4 [Phytophthora citrophthora]